MAKVHPIINWPFSHRDWNRLFTRATFGEMARLICVVLVSMLACSEPKEPYIPPHNAVGLIASDSTKTWKLAKRMNNGNRMNMDGCFLSFKQTYRADMTMTDNNGEQANCGESLNATWEIVKDEKGHSFIKATSPQIPELLGIDEEFKNFKILYLSKDTLKLAFYHRQFSDRTTTIVDYLVPEDFDVPDRDFHH